MVISIWLIFDMINKFIFDMSQSLLHMVYVFEYRLIVNNN